MDNFKAVYLILSSLEKDMDCSSSDLARIRPEELGVTHERWARYLEMMLDVGYIKGVEIRKQIRGETMVNAQNIRITLKGLEYLQENSIMKKIYRSIKGLADVIP